MTDNNRPGPEQQLQNLTPDEARALIREAVRETFLMLGVASIGGSGVTSRMRWSSVSLVFSLKVSRPSCREVGFGLIRIFRVDKEKPPGLPAVCLVLASLAFHACLLLQPPGGGENQKYAKKKREARMGRQCSTGSLMPD